MSGRAVLRAVGVGLVETAVGTTRALLETGARTVFFIGTAGRYPGTSPLLRVGEAVIARRIKLLSTAAARGEGYLPRPLPRFGDTDRAVRHALARATSLPVADVACPMAVTTAPATARRAAKATGCALENLEAFAAARAAFAQGAKFACVLGVSNAVGPKAHAEWRAHGSRAAACAGEAVLAFLTR